MLIEIAGLTKGYHGLRPLRVRSLTVWAHERVALSGVEPGASEALVNLLSGASLPDTGRVRMLGRDTADIRTDTEWLGWLDQFGIITPRAVLLDAYTVAQNLAMPFTLDLDPIPAEVRGKVAELAKEIEIDPQTLEMGAGIVAPPTRARLQLGRAVALNPKLLLMEHPTAGLHEEDAKAFGKVVKAVADRRGLAVLAITEDTHFARVAAHRRLKLQPASGEVKPVGRWPAFWK